MYSGGNIMDRRKRLLVCLAGLSICMGFLLTEEITVQAGEKEGHDFMCSGVGTVLDPNDFTVDEPEKQQEELNIYQKFEAEQARMETELAMANVQNALNVRAQANEKSEKVGFLYKDCGGTILEQENGWTKIKSGNVIGWAKDEYLVFGEDAEKMAEDVGNWIVKLNSEAVRVRMEPNEEAETICYLAKDDAVDFIEIVNDEWVQSDMSERNTFRLIFILMKERRLKWSVPESGRRQRGRELRIVALFQQMLMKQDFWQH